MAKTEILLYKIIKVICRGKLKKPQKVEKVLKIIGWLPLDLQYMNG